MSKPNSVITRFRRFLAAVIEPKPDHGEAWCVGCSFSGGKTIVLAPDGMIRHAQEHASRAEPGQVTITGWQRLP